MDKATRRQVKTNRAVLMEGASGAARQLEKSAEAVLLALSKGDLQAAGYFAASVRPQSDSLMDLLLELRVTDDTVAVLTEGEKS
jgi:hypothetical protein